MNKLIAFSILVFAIAACAYPQANPDHTYEVQSVLTVIDERIAGLHTEIPKIQEKLKQSREDYKKIIAKIPKDHRLMCVDTVSNTLEDQLVKYKTYLKSLQEEKKKLAKSIKTEQDAAANP